MRWEIWVVLEWHSWKRVTGTVGVLLLFVACVVPSVVDVVVMLLVWLLLLCSLFFFVCVINKQKQTKRRGRWWNEILVKLGWASSFINVKIHHMQLFVASSGGIQPPQIMDPCWFTQRRKMFHNDDYKTNFVFHFLLHSMIDLKYNQHTTTTNHQASSHSQIKIFTIINEQ